MEDETSIAVPIPLDSDGFLRRECPTCEREFKWRPGADEETDTVQPDPAGYFCPYCGIQAPTDHWLTQAQVEHLNAIGARRFAGPLLDQFERSGFKVERNLPDEPSELTEDDDMRRVEFACHPQEPLKVLEDWSGPVQCLVCGAPSGG
jgi:hypothetical protein